MAPSPSREVPRAEVLAGASGRASKRGRSKVGCLADLQDMAGLGEVRDFLDPKDGKHTKELSDPDAKKQKKKNTV